MRWVSYKFAGEALYGVAVDDGIINATRLFDRAPATLRDALEQGLVSAIPDTLPSPDTALCEVSLAPPIVNPRKILCVGVNYHDHSAEMGIERAEYPTIFTRFADTQIGAGSAVRIPEQATLFDYEGELAVIIGRPLHHADQTTARAAIAGYSCFNDFSARDWQFHTSQWLPGKNFAGSGAAGPYLVTADEIIEIEKSRLVTMVNGEVRQDAVIDDLIFTIPEILVYISSFTQLLPGDIIVTGTPAGVGASRQPPQYLQPGDSVVVEIDGVGRLENMIIAWQQSTANTSGN